MPPPSGGGETPRGVQTQQPRQQPDRLLLDVGRHGPKRRTRGQGMKQRGLRQAWSVHGRGISTSYVEQGTMLGL